MADGIDVIRAIKAGTQVPPAGIITLKLDLGWKWIDEFSPGKVKAHWEYDPAYDDLENATIAGWVGCLAEQIMFYATNTLIKDGQVTRTIDLRMSYLERIRAGRIGLEASVETYQGDTMWVEAKFRLPDGKL